MRQYIHLLLRQHNIYMQLITSSTLSNTTQHGRTQIRELNHMLATTLATTAAFLLNLPAAMHAITLYKMVDQLQVSTCDARLEVLTL